MVAEGPLCQIECQVARPTAPPSTTVGGCGWSLSTTRAVAMLSCLAFHPTAATVLLGRACWTGHQLPSRLARVRTGVRTLILAAGHTRRWWWRMRRLRHHSKSETPRRRAQGDTRAPPGAPEAPVSRGRSLCLVVRAPLAPIAVEKPCKATSLLKSDRILRHA